MKPYGIIRPQLQPNNFVSVKFNEAIDPLVNISKIEKNSPAKFYNLHVVPRDSYKASTHVIPRSYFQIQKPHVQISNQDLESKRSLHGSLPSKSAQNSSILVQSAVKFHRKPIFDHGRNTVEENKNIVKQFISDKYIENQNRQINSLGSQNGIIKDNQSSRLSNLSNVNAQKHKENPQINKSQDLGNNLVQSKFVNEDKVPKDPAQSTKIDPQPKWSKSANYIKRPIFSKQNKIYHERKSSPCRNLSQNLSDRNVNTEKNERINCNTPKSALLQKQIEDRETKLKICNHVTELQIMSRLQSIKQNIQPIRKEMQRKQSHHEQQQKFKTLKKQPSFQKSESKKSNTVQIKNDSNWSNFSQYGSQSSIYNQKAYSEPVPFHSHQHNTIGNNQMKFKQNYARPTKDQYENSFSQKMKPEQNRLKPIEIIGIGRNNKQRVNKYKNNSQMYPSISSILHLKAKAVKVKSPAESKLTERDFSQQSQTSIQVIKINQFKPFQI